MVSDKGIYRPFLNSIYITTVGTLVALTFNAMGAYTLSKRDLPGNRIFIYMIVITMMFSGGLVPLYLVVKAVGLIDKINGLILMSFVNGWNMILIRNYYWSIPSSLPESARMDGANEFIIFSRIIIPLSKPVLAAIALFTGVGYWNMFFHAVIFINSPEKYTFPVKLNEMIVVKREMVHQFEQMAGGAMDTQNLNIEGVSSAIIILSMIPVIIVYPYLQKYFARGILIGSIKG
ncbi:MAG: carbohydrate ABC transporter permease [Spirochaetia bacterium]